MPRAAVRDADQATAKPQSRPQPAAPRYFEDAAGHETLLERLRPDEAKTPYGIELAERWSPRASVLFVASLSSMWWALIAGIVWAVAG